MDSRTAGLSNKTNAAVARVDSRLAKLFSRQPGRSTPRATHAPAVLAAAGAGPLSNGSQQSSFAYTPLAMIRPAILSMTGSNDSSGSNDIFSESPLQPFESLFYTPSFETDTVLSPAFPEMPEPFQSMSYTPSFESDTVAFPEMPEPAAQSIGLAEVDLNPLLSFAAGAGPLSNGSQQSSFAYTPLAMIRPAILSMTGSNDSSGSNDIVSESPLQPFQPLPYTPSFETDTVPSPGFPEMPEPFQSMSHTPSLESDTAAFPEMPEPAAQSIGLAVINDARSDAPGIGDKRPRRTSDEPRKKKKAKPAADDELEGSDRPRAERNKRGAMVARASQDPEHYRPLVNGGALVKVTQKKFLGYSKARVICSKFSPHFHFRRDMLARIDWDPDTLEDNKVMLVVERVDETVASPSAQQLQVRIYPPGQEKTAKPLVVGYTTGFESIVSVNVMLERVAMLWEDTQGSAPLADASQATSD